MAQPESRSFSFLSDQQMMVRDVARGVAADAIAPTAMERDRTAAWPHAELKALADLGFMGMLPPAGKEYPISRYMPWDHFIVPLFGVHIHVPYCKRSSVSLSNSLASCIGEGFVAGLSKFMRIW